MRYIRLFPDSICYNCAGCTRLEDHKFRGIKPYPNKANTSCRSFAWGLSPKEIEEKDKSDGEFFYGSSVGFNS